MTELMPCPWCKTNEGAALGYIGQPAVAWSVSCICCGAEGPRGDTPSEAARLWNTRPTAQAVAVDDSMHRALHAYGPLVLRDAVDKGDFRVAMAEHERKMRAALQAAMGGVKE